MSRTNRCAASGIGRIGRHDILQFKDGIASSEIQLSASGNNLVIAIAGTTDQITVTNYFLGATNGGYALDEMRFADGSAWSRNAINERALLQAQGTENADVLSAYPTGSVIHGFAGNDTSAIVRRIEVKAGSGDLDGALAELAQLPPPMRAPAEIWIKKAQARAAAVEASRRFAADALAGLGK